MGYTSRDDERLDEMKDQVKTMLETLHSITLSDNYDEEKIDRLHQAYNKLMEIRNLLK